MATDVREWARVNGWPDINVRGKMPEGVQAAYDAAHPDVVSLEVPVTGNPPPPDYPDGMSDADFAGPGTEAEQRPRNVTTLKPKDGGGRGRLGQWAKGQQGGKGKPKTGTARKRPRVPVDRLISNAWTMLAQAARPMPPTSRVLMLQAPVAGALLEGVVKDTSVDAILQPLARFEQSGEVVFALIGPPMLTTAVAMNPQAAPFLLPVLRESLMMLMKVGGPAVAEQVAKGAADEQKYGPAVDGMLAMLFAEVPTTPEQAQAEAEAMRAAQSTVSGQPA